MAGKPSTQFYPGDWWRAVDLRKCCMATQGIWFNMLLVMWDEQEQGKIKGTRVEICRVVGCQLIELRRFVEDNKVHKFADVTLSNKYVTIINRRMYAAYLDRMGIKRRVRRYRDKEKRKCNADVTPPSSTSSSTSTSTLKKEYMSIFDEARKLFKGTKRGLQTEYEYFIKTHADWKDVLPLLEPAVKQQIIWRADDGRYWKNFKTWTYNRCWEEDKGVSNGKRQRTDGRADSQEPFVR